jgi:hypothetical protein
MMPTTTQDARLIAATVLRIMSADFEAELAAELRSIADTIEHPIPSPELDLEQLLELAAEVPQY